MVPNANLHHPTVRLAEHTKYNTANSNVVNGEWRWQTQQNFLNWGF